MMSVTPIKSRSDAGTLDGASHEEVWAAHTHHEFVSFDVSATMATMSDDPHVIHVPVATGGRGRQDVRRFYSELFIGRSPGDVELRLLSRTVGTNRVVDEMLFSFTHDVDMPWMLPNVVPTGRRVEIPLVVIVGFRSGKVASEHIYWDQASVLAQIGLLPDSIFPVLGADQARALLDPAARLNALVSRSGG